MRLPRWFLAAALAVAAAPAHAIVVNEQAFVASGGNLRDLPGTAPRVFDALRNASMAPSFTSVGEMGGCTATLLGIEGSHAWILTAAHCVPNTIAPVMPASLTFRDRHGTAVAGGMGLAYIHPYRIKRPPGLGPIGTDIALVKLPLYPWGHASAQSAPELYDGADDYLRPVKFVGHGQPGVGLAYFNGWPKQAPRRMWGESIMSGIGEEGYAIGAGYSPTGTTEYWARLAPGDSGSAWWQRHEGQFSIVATTHGGHSYGSLGTRVSKYADWIDGLFPGAARYSERMRVSDLARFRSHDHALEAPHGTVYYVVAPGQAQVQGPTRGIWTGASTHSIVTVPVKHVVTGANGLAKLRATRDLGACGPVRMEDAVSCSGQRSGPLIVQFHAADNPGLASGEWRGRVEFEAVGWHASYRHRFGIDVAVQKGARGKVTRTAAYQSPDYATFARHGTVSYLVPAQASASGPAGAIWNGASTHSTILVLARNALTQEMRSVRLRAQRYNGCYWNAMNDAVSCYGSRAGPLRVTYDARDNGGLPAGVYRGVVHLQANGWHDSAVRDAIRLEVEIDMLN